MSTYISSDKNNYPGLDRGFNARYTLDGDLSPDKKEGIWLVQNADDVKNALNEITNTHNAGKLPLGQVRMVSGGHCYEDFTYQSKTGNPNGARYIIDLSTMRGIYEETVDGVEYVVVEPGASNWLIQQTLHARYGVALPGGSCYSVCAGGHVAGGGYGLLSRLHGLTVDYLAGVEMVIRNQGDNSAQEPFTVRAFTTEDKDSLNKACRGAGAGHFGVITKYYFRKDALPLAPERALLITLPVPWNKFYKNGTVDAQEFYKFLHAYFEACGNLAPQAFTLGKLSAMTTSDSIMSVTLQVVYGPSSGHDAALGGTAYAPLTTRDEAMQVIEDFKQAMGLWITTPEALRLHGQLYSLPGHPVSATVALGQIYDLPWIDMTQLLNGSGENQNGKYKSSYIAGDFTQEEAEAMAQFLTNTLADHPAPAGADLTQTLIQIDSYGAQINAMDTNITPQNTMIAARGSVLKTQYQTYWKNYAEENIDPAQREQAIVEWFNYGYNAIHRAAQGNVANSGFPLWGEKYQGCYFNYPDRQIGVNNGYKKDPGEVYNGDFCELYYGADVAVALKKIKKAVDPENFFAFAQSIPVTDASTPNA